MEAITKILNKPDEEIPNFFVLDKDGKIVYQTSGIYTKKMRDIEGKIEQMRFEL